MSTPASNTPEPLSGRFFSRVPAGAPLPRVVPGDSDRAARLADGVRGTDSPTLDWLEMWAEPLVAHLAAAELARRSEAEAVAIAGGCAPMAA